jgi:hypothetical protein
MSGHGNLIDTNFPISVANGGTGDSSLTAYAVLCGGTTSTGNVQSIAGVGTSGQVLTSNGAGALPTFQPASGGSGITTVGDVTSGSVAFNGTAGTTLTSTTAGLTLTTASNSGGNGANASLTAGTSTFGSGTGGAVFITGGQGTLGGGIIEIAGGYASTSGTGGEAILIPGGSASGSAGNIIIGSSGTTGTGTNVAAGFVSIVNAPGTGTGGAGFVNIQSATYGLSSGTSTQTTVNRVYVNGVRSLTSTVFTGLATIDVAATTGNHWGGGFLYFVMECTDGTNYQVYSGQLSYSIVATAGPTYTSQVVSLTNSSAVSSGTLTVTPSFSGNTVGITPVTSLTPTSFMCTFTIFNNSHADITV